MANVINANYAYNSVLPPQMADELFNMVRGESALAKLSGQTPIPFNGLQEMVFSLDSDASIVGESQPKVNGGGTATAKVIRPIKFEYGLRVSDEFLYGSEEYRLNVLRTFLEGAARKIARGFDIAAMHGINPKTKQVSALISDSFDTIVTNVVTYNAATPDANVASAIALVEASGTMVNGIAMSPTMKGAVASLTANGALKYPDFAWGNAPETLGGTTLAVNPTVSISYQSGNITQQFHGYVGDFTAFKWGYAKDVTLDVIEYGNPDNDAEAGDLKGHNQVYLRAEAYIGWGILAPDYFASIMVE